MMVSGTARIWPMKSPALHITAGCGVAEASACGSRTLAVSQGGHHNSRLCEPAEFSLVGGMWLCYYSTRDFALKCPGIGDLPGAATGSRWRRFATTTPFDGELK